MELSLTVPCDVFIYGATPKDKGAMHRLVRIEKGSRCTVSGFEVKKIGIRRARVLKLELDGYLLFEDLSKQLWSLANRWSNTFGGGLLHDTSRSKRELEEQRSLETEMEALVLRMCAPYLRLVASNPHLQSTRRLLL